MWRQLKYEFSRIALIEMYNAYQLELKKSFKNLSKDAKKRAKVRRWGYATHAYLESLDHYFFQLDSGKSLDFFISKQNKIVLLIGEQAVIITGPNTGANKQIEHNIVDLFCQQYDCREYFNNTQFSSKNLPRGEEEDSHNEQAVIYDTISGSWSIKNNMQADYVTSNGLVFNFSSIKNRTIKESWALGIANESDLLITSLGSAQVKGNKIHWPLLKIVELPVTENVDKIIINRSGDFIKLPLPLLGSSELLFIQLLPWIKDRFDNKRNSRIIIDQADQFINY